MSKVGNADIKDKSVVCPFYKWADTNRIGCEGLSSENTLSIVFGDPNKRNEYKVRFCRSLENYKGCRVCQMLYEKYVDEE